jgi:hypothetical protein
MPSYNTNLKTWGATGQEYPDNYNYVEGEQPVDAWDNFLTSNVINDVQHLVDATNNELIARDGTVAMNADLPLGGNNIDNVGNINDSNGNTVYDVSNGWIPQERVEQGSGSGLDADTVDGKEAADIGNRLASTTDDGSDITHYKVVDPGGTGGTVCDITGSGVLINSYLSTGSFYTSSSHIHLDITVDGGPTQQFYGLDVGDGNNEEHVYIEGPSIAFESSLLVEAVNDNGQDEVFGDGGAGAYVKQ